MKQLHDENTQTDENSMDSHDSLSHYLTSSTSSLPFNRLLSELHQVYKNALHNSTSHAYLSRNSSEKDLPKYFNDNQDTQTHEYLKPTATQSGNKIPAQASSDNGAFSAFIQTKGTSRWEIKHEAKFDRSANDFSSMLNAREEESTTTTKILMKSAPQTNLNSLLKIPQGIHHILQRAHHHKFRQVVLPSNNFQSNSSLEAHQTNNDQRSTPHQSPTKRCVNHQKQFEGKNITTISIDFLKGVQGSYNLTGKKKRGKVEKSVTQASIFQDLHPTLIDESAEVDLDNMSIIKSCDRISYLNQEILKKAREDTVNKMKKKISNASMTDTYRGACFGGGLNQPLKSSAITASNVVFSLMPVGSSPFSIPVSQHYQRSRILTNKSQLSSQSYRYITEQQDAVEQHKQTQMQALATPKKSGFKSMHSVTLIGGEEEGGGERNIFKTEQQTIQSSQQYIMMKGRKTELQQMLDYTQPKAYKDQKEKKRMMMCIRHQSEHQLIDQKDFTTTITKVQKVNTQMNIE